MEEQRSQIHVADLIDRLSRLHQTEFWQDELNPTQMAALRYLACANVYSRSPSHVADYLGSTRGTVSQSLKTLSTKGFIRRVSSSADKRSVRYDVTPSAHKVVEKSTAMEHVISQLNENENKHLASLLSKVLHTTLRDRGGRSFGICSTCKHHETEDGRSYCRLLEVGLATGEISLICHEHEKAA